MAEVPLVSSGQSVVDWLQQSVRIRVADYQRAYTWNESLVTSFVESVLRSLEENSAESPDIGLVIVEKTDRGEFIADGQQRILTFAMLLIEAFQWKATLAPKLGFGANSRLSWLVNQPIRNLTSWVNAQAARRYIRSALPKFSVLSGMQRSDQLEKLKQVTFSVLELSNAEAAEPDLLITALFRDVNTTAKQLNGGQILKATHLGQVLPRKLRPKDKGPVPQKFWATAEVQSVYETWRRHHENLQDFGLGLDLDPCELKCLNTRKPISLERFIDSPQQEAWYFLGCGFVQSVQGILLSVNEWWRELAAQDGERLDPFDRLNGTQDGDLDDNRTLPEFFWSAEEPLKVQRGDGFFQMVNRFAQLYDDYYTRLRALLEPEAPPSKADLTSPGRLVCEAASGLASFFKAVNANYRAIDPESPVWNVVSVKDERRMKPGLMDPAWWLAVHDLRRPSEGAALSDSYGCIPTALFASALYWCDRYGERQGERHERRRHFRALSDDACRWIRRLLMRQLLSARMAPQYKSTLNGLALKQAADAARLSTTPESAYWQFVRLAGAPRCLAYWAGLDRVAAQIDEDSLSEDELGKEARHAVLSILES